MYIGMFLVITNLIIRQNTPYISNKIIITNTCLLDIIRRVNYLNETQLKDTMGNGTSQHRIVHVYKNNSHGNIKKMAHTRMQCSLICVRNCRQTMAIGYTHKCTLSIYSNPKLLKYSINYVSIKKNYIYASDSILISLIFLFFVLVVTIQRKYLRSVPT